ncbi:MAG: hypothetical protein IJD06_05805 [Clostridia bacterium]|nr:hypothetical protein [Clostridia bacterium]
MEKNSVMGTKKVSVRRVLLLAVAGMGFACVPASVFVRLGLFYLRDARSFAAFIDFIAAGFFFFMGAWFAAVLLRDAFSGRCYLFADGERLDARTARGEEIHLPLSAVTDAEVFMDTLYLYEGKTVHVLNGLGNAREISAFLLDRIAYRPYIPEPEEAWEAYGRCKNKVHLCTVGPAAGILCSLGLTAWISTAAAGGVSGILTPLDIFLFLVYLTAECGGLLLSVFLLVRRAHVRFALQYSERLLTSALAYRYRQEALELFPTLVETKYFERYIYRIVVVKDAAFGKEDKLPEEEQTAVCGYVLQQFCPEAGGWTFCRMCGFDSWEELYDDLAGTFDDARFLP